MSNLIFEVTKYKENPQWNRIDIKKKYSEWSIEYCNDEDISIECSTDNSSNTLFLNKDELKQVIEFLQEHKGYNK